MRTIGVAALAVCLVLMLAGCVPGGEPAEPSKITPPGAFVGGTVTDAERRPVADAVVTLGLGEVEIATATGADGRFRFDRISIPGRRCLNGTLTVDAGDARPSLAPYTNVNFPLTANAEHDFPVTLRSTPSGTELDPLSDEDCAA